MKFIDDLLDRITMYRLVLYYLIFLLVVAAIFAGVGILPFSPVALIVSTSSFVFICWVTNKIFANFFDAPTNVESVYISALILALIISPMKSISDFPFVLFAGILTMASKYILAINNKHIFNPVAVAVVLTALGFGGSASWWIGTISMLPFSLLGILIVRKIRRADLVFYFFIAALVTMFGFTFWQGRNILTTLGQIITSSPIFFFACVMLTEPLTTPPRKNLQIMYGVLVGIVFAPQFHIGTLYATPEQALVIGNIFSYLVSPKYKVVTSIQQKLQYGVDMMDFIFPLKKKLAFTPGQYMEWTLPHNHSDSRGNRRYFTIASSPTEDTLRLGIKFYPNGSSFKKTMLTSSGIPIVGSQVSGDFVLPKDPRQKLAFLAGGIGITPFRSMVKYLIDTKQVRNIVLLYSNKTMDEIMYYDIFSQAERELGIRTVYTLTDTTKIPSNWQAEVGRIDEAMIASSIPDFKERTFYLSGPHSMVTAYEEVLAKMNIPQKQIKTDFFPGFA